MRFVSLLIAWSFVISQGACDGDQSAWSSGPAIRSLHHGAPIAHSRSPQDFPVRAILAEGELEESESEEDSGDAKALFDPFHPILASQRFATILSPTWNGTFVRPALLTPFLRC
jgi:hypothetical protein